ncbi:MAG TPA: hypothetical protein VEG34_04190, partial [Thermoanaerobaculia bacterium]|nr:hypothetical protein [Thermoanaerobaculia bacterium]
MTQAMWSRRRSRSVAAALVLCAVLGGALWAKEEEEVTAAFQLTEAEKLLAVQLTEQALSNRDLKNGSALYLVETELVVEKPEVEGEAGRRLARITHYRYDGDLSIFTLIDLDAQATR